MMALTHKTFHACATGDCPHRNRQGCVDALVSYASELEDEIKTLTADRTVRRDASHGFQLDLMDAMQNQKGGE